nr:MAG TPA: hypothetical protein [Caudoviricetes sp.]
MTVQELRNILEDYPADINVKVTIEHQVADLNCVNCGVDMNTNQRSVWLLSRENKTTRNAYDDFLEHWDEFHDKIYGGNRC